MKIRYTAINPINQILVKSICQVHLHHLLPPTNLFNNPLLEPISHAFICIQFHPNNKALCILTDWNSPIVQQKGIIHGKMSSKMGLLNRTSTFIGFELQVSSLPNHVPSPLDSTSISKDRLFDGHL